VRVVPLVPLDVCLARFSMAQRAAIFARARTIPEFVITASGHFFSAAFLRNSKSSCVILTFTCTVRFMPPVSANSPYATTLLLVSLDTLTPLHPDNLAVG